MNKRGIELSLETVVGLIAGALIILALFGGMSKLVSTFFPADNFDDFSNFKAKADNSIVNKVQKSNLKLSYDDLVFSLNKAENQINFPVTEKIRNPITNQEISISSISKPIKCRDLACICKCKLNNQAKSEFKCREEETDCQVFNDIDKISGDIITVSVENEENKIVHSKSSYFLISSHLNSELKKSSKDSFNLPLSIEKQENNLVIAYSG
jgi:hypothetical protein